MNTSWLRVFLAGGVLAGTFTPAHAQERVARAQDFADSIGVNVHTMYTDGGYAKLDEVIAALDYLGVKNLRDGAPDSRFLAETRYGKLAAFGFKFDFVVEKDPVETLARLDKFIADYPGSVAAVEGPNEVNNWPVTFGGLKGHDGAVAFQQALYADVKADTHLSGIPVFNFTDYPWFAGAADFYNTHPYPKRGAQPFAQLETILAPTAPPMPGKPRVITEIGYNAMLDPTLWKGSAEWAPVDQGSQAVFTANLLLDAFALDVPHTYIYALLDAYPDPTNNSADRHLGLFDLDYKPKPAAIAIHNLITLLADDNDANRDFAVRPVSFSLAGLPKNAHFMILEKADGTDMIAIWNEPAIWDPKSTKPIPQEDTMVTIGFGGGRRDVALYDPVRSPEAVANFAQAANADLRLGERPIVVALSAP